MVPGLTGRVIDAAKASGATVLIPGNIYGYGEGSGPFIDKTTPKRAKNILGRVRNVMEESYRKAGVPTIILRAGDFIDTEASGNWFESHIAKRFQIPWRFCVMCIPCPCLASQNRLVIYGTCMSRIDSTEIYLAGIFTNVFFIAYQVW